jgi:cytochrome c biogenesis protein CcmG/thiol:disulfide interchange protein DsbE
MSDLLEQLEQAESPSARRGLSAGALVLLAGVVVAVIVIGVAFLRSQQTQPTSGLAPDFTLPTLDGETFRLSDQRGQVVVINFWASWCGPCRDEAPALQRIWERYRDQGVMVVGVTYADEPDDSRAFMREFGVTYPNLDDARSEVSKDFYHITGVPETFVVDQAGNVARFYFSVVNEAELTAVIDELLAEGA